MPFLSQLFQNTTRLSNKVLVYSNIFQMLVRPVRESQVSSELKKEMKRYLHMTETQCLCLQLYTELYLLNNFSLQYSLCFDMVKM